MFVGENMNKRINVLKIAAVCFLLASAIFILLSDFKAYIVAPLATADVLFVFFAFRKHD